MSCVYVIKGDPTPLARARHGRGRTWDPQKQLKLVYGIELERQHNNAPWFDGPLHLDIVFFMPIPKTSTKRRHMIDGTPHRFRPDLDNTIKFILDVATGILFKDDAIISSINAKKLYDLEPRTEFIITEIENGTATTATRNRSEDVERQTRSLS